jgi:hypothetical protein
MLISLPIVLNNKSVYKTFQIIYKERKKKNLNEDRIIVKPYNTDINLYQIVTSSNLYGINVISLHFPLVLTVINNVLSCDLFFIINTLSTQTDFFNIMITNINSHFNKKFEYFSSNKINVIVNTIKLNNTIDDTEYTSIENLLNRIFYRTNRYLNFCLAIIASTDNYSVSNNSKISQIINSINSLKINFYGNTSTVSQHIENIKTVKIYKKRYYFISDGNKLIKIYITNINNSIISYQKNSIIKNKKEVHETIFTLDLSNTKYTITSYPCKFKQHITINNLVKYIVVYNYNNIISIVANILYKKHPNYIKLLLSFYENNNDNLVILKELTPLFKTIDPLYLQYMEDIPNDISFNKFKELINDKTFDVNILNNLFTHYIHPLSFNKRVLNVTFVKILYYSFKFCDYILDSDYILIKSDKLKINNKIKSIYLYILKIYKSIKNNDISIIYNNRIYTDLFIHIILKILFFNDMFDLFKDISTNVEPYRNIFINNIIIIQILLNITWKTVSKQIILLKYVISMKATNSKLFIVDDKINKYIINNKMDSRLKKVIINPLLMFIYLKKENDYYKWIITIKEQVIKLFYNPIILKESDYGKLSKIIYLISLVTTQHLENKDYQKLINYLQNNHHIILFNDKINIKIKDIFKNNILNLGYLAKHINEKIENTPISITDDIVENDIQLQLKKMTKKYYKYKGRYLEMKCSEYQSKL